MDGSTNAKMTTIDQTPTQGSTNAVSSGGVYTALANKADKFTACCIAVHGQVSNTGDIYGLIKYNRINSDGYGFLSLSVYVPNGSSATYSSIPLSTINSLLGLNLSAVTNEHCGTWNWYPDSTFSGTWFDRMQWGSYSYIASDNSIRVGRKYSTEHSNWGDWNWQNVQGLNNLDCLLVKEN